MHLKRIVAYFSYTRTLSAQLCVSHSARQVRRGGDEVEKKKGTSALLLLLAKFANSQLRSGIKSAKIVLKAALMANFDDKKRTAQLERKVGKGLSS